MLTFLALAASLLSQSSAVADLVESGVVKPPALVAGDTIGLVAPASPIDDSIVKQAVANLQKSGYRVKLSLGYRQARGYLAASDEVRALELNRFFEDPEVKAIICLRGGYGSPRLLDRIDYDLVRANPKILVGYSDITALLTSIQKQTGLVVFHGPMAKELSGEGPPPFTARHLWGALRPDPSLFDDWGRGNAPPRTLVPGVAEGRLAGGNLSVLACTMGTPHEVDLRGAILFLEDVAEKPFRIDRMLNQLRLSGKLSDVSGVLLGQFTGCSAPETDAGLGLEQVFQDYFGGLQVPVLADFPAGHIADQATLPFGIRVRLDATERKLSLLEAPVE
jgi:muramoyltetrapeptide carboxypeptidase